MLSSLLLLLLPALLLLLLHTSNPAKSAYIHALAVDYSENVKQQKDAIEWVVQFMRNQ